MYPSRHRRDQWERFWGAVKETHVALNRGEEFYFIMLFAVALVPLPLWPFVRYAAWDGVFWYTFEHATVPIFLAVALGSRLFMPRFWATSDWFVRGFTFVSATAMLTFLAQAHVAAINQWYGESESVVIAGIVLDTFDNDEGAFGIRVDTTGGTIELRVARREYERIDVGDAYSRRYMRGSLGLLYTEE